MDCTSRRKHAADSKVEIFARECNLRSSNDVGIEAICREIVNTYSVQTYTKIELTRRPHLEGQLYGSTYEAQPSGFLKCDDDHSAVQADQDPHGKATVII